MKRILTLVVAGLTLFGLAANTSAGHHRHSRSVTIDTDHDLTISDGHSHFLGWDDHTWFDFDDGAVVITHKERGEPRSTVEITEKHELIVDGERVPLTLEQTELVAQFHDDCMELVDRAKEVGIEGARIGLQGAKIGIQAVTCVFKLLSPNYDSDDLEAEMEQASSRIEARADHLEKKAQLIEDLADDIDDQADDLRRAIPALDNLGWF